MSATATRFHLPAGYVERSEPAYFVDETVAVWQPDLYAEVAADARFTGTVLDVGCGSAGKLAALPEAVRVIGVDTGTNAALARQTLGQRGAVIECDLEVSPLPLWEDPRGLTIICADVIEHLVDPAYLLAGLAAAHRAGCPLIVVSTPDRDRLHGSDHHGPPANPCHVREWAPSEFEALFADYGMTGVLRWTRSSSLDDRHDTMVLTIAQP